MTSPNTQTVDVAAMESRLVPVEAQVTARATQEPNGAWTVTASFHVEHPTDRDGGYVWSLRPTHARLATRLVDAIYAGVVFSDFRKGTDVDGKTYITARNNILTRTMNADLGRLGY